MSYGTSEADGWILKLKTKGNSHWQTTNFLWRSGNTFVMDNHCAAAWCWFQILERNAGAKLVHIDAHEDLHDEHNIKPLPEALLIKPIEELSFDEYLNLGGEGASGSRKLLPGTTTFQSQATMPRI